MSPSKKANNKVSIKKTKSAPGKTKPSVRSSRAKTAPPTKRSLTKIAGKARKKQSRISGSNTEIALSPPVQAPVAEQPAQVVKQTSDATTNILRVVALLVVIGITVFIYSIRGRVEEFKEYGYVGVFLVALLANATVLLPAPGVAIIYAMGSVFNPFLVGLSAGTGGALGEISGYLAGFSGQAVIERADVYDRIKPWVDQYGGWAIMVLSAIPNPFFDVAGIAAGIAKMKLRTFLFSTWVGQIIKMTLFALAGRYSIDWLTRFFG